MANLRESLMPLGKQAVKLRDKDGLPWFEIAQRLDVPQGKALAAYEVASWPDNKVFKGTDAAKAKEIVRLRDKEALSWARIAARVDVTEAKCRTIYEETSGEPHRGNRIGKGGRYPSDVERPAKTAPAKVTKAAASKKAPAKTAANAKATGTRNVNKQLAIHQMNKDQLTARLTGKVIKFDHNGRVKTMKVGEVVNLAKKGGNLTVADAKGNEFTFNISDDLVDAKA
jgi:biotin carboxyl carrier protein